MKTVDPTKPGPSTAPIVETDDDDSDFAEDEEEEDRKKKLAITEELGRQTTLCLQAEIDESERKLMEDRKKREEE